MKALKWKHYYIKIFCKKKKKTIRALAYIIIKKKSQLSSANKIGNMLFTGALSLRADDTEPDHIISAFQQRFFKASLQLETFYFSWNTKYVFVRPII